MLARRLLLVALCSHLFPAAWGLGPALRPRSARVGTLFASPAAGAAAAASLHSHLRHQSQFKTGITELKRLLAGRLKLASGGVSLGQQVREIVDDPRDVVIVLVLWGLYRPFLQLLYKVQEYIRRKFSSEEHEVHSFKFSLFGYLEEPFRLLSLYMPFLYIVDLVSIGLHALGLDSHLKGDVPRLAATCATSVIGGKFATGVKDWLLHNSRILSGREHHRRDEVREHTVDELSSLAIWALVCSICIEAMKVEMGFALGSVFAVGGTVTASVVLAMRSTFENVVGGLLLKLQDKFRVGEVITIPMSAGGAAKKGSASSEEGTVEELNYVTTVIRRDDNSCVSVPNHVFTHGEIINWSRTPFRRFTTQVLLATDELAALPGAIGSIREALGQTSGVETQQRSIVVAAAGFKDNKILIDVACHLSAASEEEAADLRTRVSSAILRALEAARKAAKT